MDFRVEHEIRVIRKVVKHVHGPVLDVRSRDGVQRTGSAVGNGVAAEAVRLGRAPAERKGGSDWRRTQGQEPGGFGKRLSAMVAEPGCRSYGRIPPLSERPNCGGEPI